MAPLGAFRSLTLVLASAFVLSLTSGAADAQSWKHPELVDYDQEADNFSKFWEGALASDLEGYVELIKGAKRLWSVRGTAQRARALEALRTAAETHKDKPDAYYWLGKFRAENREWEACAKSLAKVYAMEPGFLPEATRAPSTLDQELADCRLYAGQYEGAIEHYKRIITLDHPRARVEQKLGEALMALGRLDEAIEFLERAALRTRGYETQYILAVALDRAERVSESRKYLAVARQGDKNLVTLKSADKIYAPAEDEHYYLGLAYSMKTSRSRDHKALALFHFRRYLALAKVSPWRKRAEQHVGSLGVPPFADDLSVQGSATWDVVQLRTALRGIEAPMRACLAKQPGLLVRIDLSAVAGTESRALQVRASTFMSTDAGDKAQERVAMDCAEAEARKLVAPKLAGISGRHASANFSLLGSP